MQDKGNGNAFRRKLRGPAYPVDSSSSGMWGACSHQRPTDRATSRQGNGSRRVPSLAGPEHPRPAWVRRLRRFAGHGGPTRQRKTMTPSSHPLPRRFSSRHSPAACPLRIHITANLHCYPSTSPRVAQVLRLALEQPAVIQPSRFSFRLPFLLLCESATLSVTFCAGGANVSPQRRTSSE